MKDQVIDLLCDVAQLVSILIFAGGVIALAAALGGH